MSERHLYDIDGHRYIDTLDLDTSRWIHISLDTEVQVVLGRCSGYFHFLYDDGVLERCFMIDT